MTRARRRLPGSGACVGAFIGVAAALVPASCTSPEDTGAGTGGSGGAMASTSSGWMHLDGGTLVDLDGDADAPYIPPDGGKPDVDVS